MEDQVVSLDLDEQEQRVRGRGMGLLDWWRVGWNAWSGIEVRVLMVPVALLCVMVDMSTEIGRAHV